MSDIGQLSESTLALIDKVCAFASSNNMFPADAPAIVMVSGGSDSTALIRIIALGRERLHLGAVRVLHVDHMLRGEESTGDARFVERLASTLGFEFVCHRVDIGAQVRETGGNMENIARQVRYELAGDELDALCAREGFPAQQGRIVVAHTLDDRTETFFMRAIVGAGPNALSSIAPLSGRVARPVLGVTRASLRAFLLEVTPSDKTPWREDSTNADTTRFRAFVRHEIVPKAESINPKLSETLCRNLDLLAEDTTLLDALAHEQAADMVETDADGLISIDASALSLMEPPLGRRVIRDVIRTLLPPDVRVDSAHIEYIQRSGSDAGFTAMLPQGLMVRNEYGRLVFRFPPSLPAEGESAGFQGGWLDVPGILNLGGGMVLEARIETDAVCVRSASTDEAYVSADHRGRLWVCHPAPGDRMCPLGMGGHSRKVSDILVDGKVSAWKRPSVWEVRSGAATDDDIIWLVGLRVDERYKIDDMKSDIVHLTLTCRPADGGQPVF